MILKSVIVLIIFSILLSCNSSKHSNDIIIDVQPFNGISSTHVLYVVNELKKVYPHVEVKKAIELPSACYNAERKRFRADSLIRFLNGFANKNYIIIGITDKDISATKNNISDWGVIELGFCPGKSCIVSTFRLSKTNTDDQLLKVAIHELGHTEGLPHCNERYCFMRDAEGHNPTNEETCFCKTCKQKLINKGWNFN